ncbi:MAG: HD domain-containing protein [Oligoflexales bacterium]|nr:HD domain-containing protein [Oligoflexales bacterium]
MKNLRLHSFLIRDETRNRCKIVPVSEDTWKKFRPISFEFFYYFFEIPSIDFSLFFRAGEEIIEFMRPSEYSHELLSQMSNAMQSSFSDVEICVHTKDYPKFEILLNLVQERKIKSLLDLEPTVDENALRIFSDLSAASQMIVKGGINVGVAEKAKKAVSHLMQQQLHSDVVVNTLNRMIICDPSLYDHSASVAMFSGVIASLHKATKNLSSKDLENLALGGLFHDVGKTCVPPSILNKPQAFTPEEYEIMKQHSALGHDEILKAIQRGAPLDSQVAQVALEHHERLDGRGYPHKKKGRFEENPKGIHYFARVVMIADVYSAMLMKRVYKEALSPEEALATMQELSPTDYDQEVFKVFEQAVTDSFKYKKKREEELKHSKITLLGEKESFMKAIKQRGGS